MLYRSGTTDKVMQVQQPNAGIVWNNMGVAYRKIGNPYYASPHLNIGISLQKPDQLKEAEEHYNKVLKN